MHQSNKKLIAALSIATAAIVSTTTHAVETASDASVTVKNAFELTNSASLDFGSIRAIMGTDSNGNGVPAKLQLFADGTASLATKGTDGDNGDTGSNITVIIEGSPAQFDIAGAAPKTYMTVTVPTSSVDIVNELSPTDQKFTLSTDGWSVYDQTASRNVALSSGEGSVRTDDSGAATFLVGATLNLASAATAVTLDDVEFVGTFKVDVAY